MRQRVRQRERLIFLLRPILPHAARSNKSLGNQEAAVAKEQMWHVIHATVAFTLDTPIQ